MRERGCGECLVRDMVVGVEEARVERTKEKKTTE